MTETLRIYMVFASFASIGCLAAIYERIGHLFIPKKSVRLLMLGNCLIVGSIGYANIRNLHSPLMSVSYAIAAGILLELSALVSLWHWYGTREGRAHSARMIGSVANAHEDDDDTIEHRLRVLSLGILALFGVLLFTLLVVAYTAVTNQRALCSFKGDLQTRADQASKILADHHGKVIHVYGITIDRATVAAQLANQEQTLRSLGSLRCP